MTKKDGRAQALLLRKKGMSYSQIKDELGISKGTLSVWLRAHPLSRERINELRAHSHRRVERFRETMRLKKETRRAIVFERVSRDIETSKDSEFVAGFYLYWGEGTKTSEYTISLTNSDPAMLICFMNWLLKLGVESNRIRAKLHTYVDQKEPVMKQFWSEILGIPVQNFYKTYVKDSRSDRKTYKGMFAHGTCSIFYHNRDMYEYVLEGVKYLREKHQIAARR